MDAADGHYTNCASKFVEIMLRFRFQRWTFYGDLPQCESRGPSFSRFKFRCGLCLEFRDVLEWAAPFPPPKALSDLKAENIGSGKERPSSLLFLI